MKIVIVEDHALFREVLRMICSHELGHEIVGQAESGADAVDLIHRLKPELVLLDLVLADDVDGFAVADYAVADSPATRLLGVSGMLNPYTLYRIEHSPLHGFVDKMTATPCVLREAVDALSKGRSFYSELFLEARLARQTDPHWFGRLLSPAEMRVLGLIGRGWDDTEIGDGLGISPTTAQTHRSRILKKLSIASTPKLVAYAVQQGFSRSPFGSTQASPADGGRQSSPGLSVARQRVGACSQAISNVQRQGLPKSLARRLLPVLTRPTPGGA